MNKSNETPSYDSVYKISPVAMDQIIDRLDDIPRSKMTGVSLIKKGDSHRLVLSTPYPEVAAQIRLRMSDFFSWQAELMEGESLLGLIHSGFDKIIPGNAFFVWREQGWAGALGLEEALDWASQ